MAAVASNGELGAAHGGEDPALEVDDNDSAFVDDDNASDTTSVASSLLKGHIENGRRYSSLRDDYWGPADDTQFEIMDSKYNLSFYVRTSY